MSDWILIPDSAGKCCDCRDGPCDPCCAEVEGSVNLIFTGDSPALWTKEILFFGGPSPRSFESASAYYKFIPYAASQVASIEIAASGFCLLHHVFVTGTMFWRVGSSVTVQFKLSAGSSTKNFSFTTPASGWPGVEQLNRTDLIINDLFSTFAGSIIVTASGSATGSPGSVRLSQTAVTISSGSPIPP
jgi:hypothetical protein